MEKEHRQIYHIPKEEYEKNNRDAIYIIDFHHQNFDQKHPNIERIQTTSYMLDFDGKDYKFELVTIYKETK